MGSLGAIMIELVVSADSWSMSLIRNEFSDSEMEELSRSFLRMNASFCISGSESIMLGVI